MLLDKKDAKNRIEIYIAPLPHGSPSGEIHPKERGDEIKITSNEHQRREKFFVWKLLEYALQQSLGLGIEQARLKKQNGKWVSDTVEISLSHSKEALAVALSGAPVGVDIESAADIDREGVAKRFFTEGELCKYASSPPEKREESFLRIWTAKEAIFKSRAQMAFIPSSIDTSDVTAYTSCVAIEGAPYVLSAFSEALSEVAVYTVKSEDILKNL